MALGGVFVRILLPIAAFLITALPISVAAQQSKCAAPDSVSEYMLTKLKSLMLVTSGDRAVARGMAGIPVVDTSTMTLVTDKTTCAKAEQAYTAAFSASTSTPSGKVHVIKVGAVYVVIDPGRKASGYYGEAVMDSRFRVLSKGLT